MITSGGMAGLAADAKLGGGAAPAAAAAAALGATAATGAYAPPPAPPVDTVLGVKLDDIIRSCHVETAGGSYFLDAMEAMAERNASIENLGGHQDRYCT